MVILEVTLPRGYEELLPYKVYELAEGGIEIKDEEDSCKLSFFCLDPFQLINEIKRIPIEVSWKIKEYEPIDYMDIFFKTFKPLRVGDIKILAPWMKPRGKGRFIFIEPGMAFGTGRHESTRLILNLMQNCDFRGRSVLDLGCGSGILSICASILGAREVLAIDNDPCATEATIKNLNYNRIGNVDVQLKDIKEVSGEFDFVLANLDLKLFEDNLEHIVSLSKPQGFLIFSGLQIGEGDKLLRNPKIKIVRRKRLNHWVGYVLIRVM